MKYTCTWREPADTGASNRMLSRIRRLRSFPRTPGGRCTMPVQTRSPSMLTWSSCGSSVTPSKPPATPLSFGRIWKRYSPSAGK